MTNECDFRWRWSSINEKRQRKDVLVVHKLRSGNFKFSLILYIWSWLTGSQLSDIQAEDFRYLILLAVGDKDVVEIFNHILPKHIITNPSHQQTPTNQYHNLTKRSHRPAVFPMWDFFFSHFYHALELNAYDAHTSYFFFVECNWYLSHVDNVDMVIFPTRLIFFLIIF